MEHETSIFDEAMAMADRINMKWKKNGEFAFRSEEKNIRKRERERKSQKIKIKKKKTTAAAVTKYVPEQPRVNNKNELDM